TGGKSSDSKSAIENRLPQRRSPQTRESRPENTQRLRQTTRRLRAITQRLRAGDRTPASTSSHHHSQNVADAAHSRASITDASGDRAIGYRYQRSQQAASRSA